MGYGNAVALFLCQCHHSVTNFVQNIHSMPQRLGIMMGISHCHLDGLMAPRLLHHIAGIRVMRLWEESKCAYIYL